MNPYVAHKSVTLARDAPDIRLIYCSGNLTSVRKYGNCEGCK